MHLADLHRLCSTMMLTMRLLGRVAFSVVLSILTVLGHMALNCLPADTRSSVGEHVDSEDDFVALEQGSRGLVQTSLPDCQVHHQMPSHKATL